MTDGIKGFSPRSSALQPVMSKTKMAQNLTRQTPKKHKNNTVNNIKITQNNIGFCGSRVESKAAYVLHLNELLQIGSGVRKNALRAS
jgi:hypothetical protein